MKSKLFARRSNDFGDFHHFQSKMFFITAGLTLAAVAIIYLIYYFFLMGRFSEWMVSVYVRLFHVDYSEAVHLYQYTFRNHQTFVMMLGIALVFFIIFRIYLTRFTRYFQEIDAKMDALVKGSAEDISLSPELLPIERKMKTVKQTIEQQKSDILAAEQRKNDLLVYLAHDLKTPLASVIGYLTLLRDEKQVSDELREKYLGISLAKAERLEDLINEFFEIARFNLSNVTLKTGQVNMTRLLEQLIFEFQPMLREKNLTCRLHMAEDIMARCDADKIQRVFDNLLRNAVLYSYPDSVIDIKAGTQDSDLVIRFVNAGDTIPPEKLDRLFEQFYRLDAARGTTGGGAGLGLAIAKQIVELHGGTITARSADNQIEFTVTIPLS